MRHTLGLLFLLALTGCVTRYHKVGATPEEIEMTNAQCQSRAYGAFPPNAQPMMIGGGYVFPSVVPVDVNVRARNAELRACLVEHGFMPAR